MANNDQLEDQLQDLFSGIELPEPEQPEERQEAPVPKEGKSAETKAGPERSPTPTVQQPALRPAQDSALRPAQDSALRPAPGEQSIEDSVDLEGEAGLEQKVEGQIQDEDQLEALKRQISLLQQANYQLQKRAIHLEASTVVSQAAVSILDPQELMQTTVDLIRERFKYYHVSFFLLDEAEEWAVVRASTGEIGRKMVAKPHRLLVGGESMVGWVCQHHKPRIALDVGADAVHFDNPLLPHTRSEIVLPLRVGDRLLGALDVQSIEENAFGNDDLRALQGMADLVAITLENARLFATTRKGTRHQRIVTAISERMQQAVNIDETLTLALKELGKTFELARATVCLGTEADLQAFGVLDEAISPQDTE